MLAPGESATTCQEGVSSRVLEYASSDARLSTGARPPVALNGVGTMDQTTIAGLIAAIAIGTLSLLLILRRQRHEREELTRESPFAAATEGMKVCPKCGRGNLWTDANCLYCGTKLRG